MSEISGLKGRNVVNIVNFIRDIEPRCEINLAEPVREQIKLADRYGFPATFLVQYDALNDPVYQSLLLPLDRSRYEFGLWYEIVEPLTAACGIKWNGRWPWDWHCHCGFSIGYTPHQREKMLDESFERFRAVFGCYPRVLGSWLLDTHTVDYAADKYGLDAVCYCKEQYGTDGYTLWGGYYGQAYYPSRKNYFMPAQTAAAQLGVPAFRMLGSDPVYQYDFGLDAVSGAQKTQGVVTLEPVYAGHGGGGGSEKWVDWFLRENYNGECLTFGYAQAGQENSFGWPRMKDGLNLQFERFEKLSREGKLSVERIGDTGREFKREYRVTPASAICAHSAWDDEEKKSVWFCTRKYRINLYSDNGGLRIRDLHLFDENVADPFENEICRGDAASYETEPAVDGNRWSGGGVIAGAYVCFDGKAVRAAEMEFAEAGGGAEVRFALEGGGKAVFRLRDDEAEIEADREFTVELRTGAEDGMPEVEAADAGHIGMKYLGAEYAVYAREGRFEGYSLHSSGARAAIGFEAKDKR